MLTVGVEVHRRTSRAVALDVAGRGADRQGPNTVAGWRQLSAWTVAPGERTPQRARGAQYSWRGLACHLSEAAGDEAGGLDLLVAEREGIVTESPRLRNGLDPEP